MKSVLILSLFLFYNVLANELRLLILHNNDIHGRFEETSRKSGTCPKRTVGEGQKKGGCVGGFPRTAHMIRKYRKLADEQSGNPVLYLNAGDTYMGTPWVIVHRWKICADFLNTIRPDAASLGNHEFDYGVKGLEPFIKEVEFPVLACNLNFDKEPSLKSINKSVVLEVRGVKIGIVGHLTTETKYMSASGKVEFFDVVESVKKETEVLEKAGIKIIIVLGHSGFDIDQKIAKEVPLADVVVGGHTNTFLWNGPQPDAEIPQGPYPTVITQSSGKKVPVVQAFAYTKYLGNLTVTFNKKGDLIRFEGQPIFLDTDVPQDPDILQMLDRYRPDVDLLEKKVVGKTRVFLQGDQVNCRKAECNMGNMITDAFVHFMASKFFVSPGLGLGWTNAPIGLLNAGTMRSSINVLYRNGIMTRGDLLKVLPFGNIIMSFQIKGEDLIKTLELGVRKEVFGAEFLQVSGLHVVYDITQLSLSRVVSVTARCGMCNIPKYEPLVHDRVYNIITTNYLLNGGNGHYILENNSFNKVEQHLEDIDMLAAYLEGHSPIYTAEEGRIKIITFKKEQPRQKPSLGAKRGICSIKVLFIIALYVSIYYK